MSPPSAFRFPGVSERAKADRSSNVMSFGLRLIAISPHIQTTLRTECLGYGDSLPYEQMDALPYLDAVVREMLRCFPSIPGTVRGLGLPRTIADL